MNPTFPPRSFARWSSVRLPRSTPSRITVPRDGVSSPASSPSSVVFPLPDGPTIATNAPWGTANETSRSTVSWCEPLWNSLVNSRATSMRILLVLFLCACAGGRDAKKRASVRGGTGNGREPADGGQMGTVPSVSGGQNRARSDSSRIPVPGSRTARKTVLIVGTSLTAGLGLDPEEAYPALLQRKADSLGLHVE